MQIAVESDDIVIVVIPGIRDIAVKYSEVL